MTYAILIEILTCFLLSVALLHRYCDMVNRNIITVVGVFISWFFSFIVIFLLPADLTSTAYENCLKSSQINPSVPTNHDTITTLGPSIPVSTSTVEDHLQTNLNHLQAPIENSTSKECLMPWSRVPKNSLTQAWRFIYWTSQFLTWLLLPIMQSYSKAGEFTSLEKLKSALRANIIYYSSFGAIFTVLLLYVIINTGIPSFANLKVVIISSSNTWGLFLLVVLLGYGLVELPRSLINRSKSTEHLNRLYFNLASVNAEKCEAEERLDDALEEVQQAIIIIGTKEHNYLKQYLDKILDKCPPDLKRRFNTLRRQNSASSYQPDSSKYNSYDVKVMILLHKKVIHAIQHHGQIMCKWRHLIEEVIEWEDVAKNVTDRESISTRSFVSTIPRERSIFQHLYTPQVEWYWKCVARVWLLRGVGASMAILSFAVVWSEIAFPISKFSSKLSIFAIFIDLFEANQEYFQLELFSLLSLGYLAICAFYTVFHMKIFNIYYLAPNKQTDEYSLLFSGLLLCRLSAPLCLNFLCLVHRESSSNQETSFTGIMGHLELIPLVNNGLNVFLPLCISAICLAIYFNVGSHFLHTLGFERFIEDDELTIDLIQTGRDLVNREKTKLLRSYDPSGAHRWLTSRENNSSEVRPRTDIRGLEQDPIRVTIENIESPTSSSSSDFSRSSLLPRDNQSQMELARVGFNDSRNRQTSYRVQVYDEEQSDSNVAGNDENAPKNTGGLFDDI